MEPKVFVIISITGMLLYEIHILARNWRKSFQHLQRQEIEQATANGGLRLPSQSMLLRENGEDEPEDELDDETQNGTQNGTQNEKQNEPEDEPENEPENEAQIVSKNEPQIVPKHMKEKQTIKLITSSMSWNQYLYYAVTLRLEHCYDKFIQYLLFRYHSNSLNILPSQIEQETSLVQLIWNTSLVTGYQGITVSNGKEYLCFRYFHYRGIHNDGTRISLNNIEVQIPASSLRFSPNQDLIQAECKVIIDNIEERIKDVYALFYFGLTGTWLHPRIHALAACISTYKDRGGIFEKMHIFTTAMNDTAPIAAIGIKNLSCPAFSNHLNHVVKQGIWKHNLVKHLSNINRQVRFIVKGRLVVKNIIKKYNVDINPEYFIAGSLLHSLDHILMYKHTSFSKLLCSEKYAIDSRCFAFMFVNCTRGWIVNTRMSNRNNPGWILEIYKRLELIDKEYADLTHYCISW
jgi:hypothetical protein